MILSKIGHMKYMAHVALGAKLFIAGFYRVNPNQLSLNHGNKPYHYAWRAVRRILDGRI